MHTLFQEELFWWNKGFINFFFLRWWRRWLCKSGTMSVRFWENGKSLAWFYYRNIETIDPMHNAQRTYMRLSTAILRCVETCTKGIDSFKNAEMADAHCSELRKHMYNPFVHVLTPKKDGPTCKSLYVCYLLCIMF